MARIFWDTNLFIYLLEDHGNLSARVAGLRKSMAIRGDQLYTSTMTMGEVLVLPAKTANEQLLHRYEAELSSGAVLIPFDAMAARVYARIRCDRTLKAPDAIQLACAAQARVDLFITNDERLSNKAIPGIQFIASLARAFL
jgi:predicted nucleic acid-binding protein